jgi:hypothetical protein
VVSIQQVQLKTTASGDPTGFGDANDYFLDIPSGYVKIAIENDHL